MESHAEILCHGYLLYLSRAQNHINRTAVSDKRMVSVLMMENVIRCYNSMAILGCLSGPTLLLKSDYKISEAGLFVTCIFLHHVIQFNYFRVSH